VTRVAFRADGAEIASQSDDGTVRVWDATDYPDARLLRGHTSYVYPVACSPDGRWIASAGWDKMIRLWDAAGGEPVAELPGHESWVAALAFSADGRRLVSSGFDAQLRVWDMATGACLAEAADDGNPFHGRVYSVAMAPGGRFAVGNRDRVSFRDLATAQEVASLTLPLRRIRLVAFSPDGRLLAASGDDGETVLADATTGQVLHWLRGHEDYVNALTFSPDGRQILTAGVDQSVRLWDAASGDPVRVMLGHTAEVFAAVFHPNGTRIASTGRDRTVCVWDADSGEELARLAGHTNYVFSLAFTPDGRTLASGSGDFTVRLWDDFPLAQRHQARHDTETARPQAERLVARLVREAGNAAGAAGRLEKERELSDPQRRAAWQVLLRQGGR
jgi:WD40 repeat protein